MPIYEYQCEECGVRFERLQSFSAEPVSTCPECNGHVHRVISPVGVIFKGSGFYVTDNRSSSSSSGNRTRGASTADTSNKSESSDSKSADNKKSETTKSASSSEKSD